MSMQDDSKALISDVGAQSENGGPAAEPCQKTTRNYRRLRSLSTNRMLHQEKEKPVVHYENLDIKVLKMEERAISKVMIHINKPASNDGDTVSGSNEREDNDQRKED